MRKKGLADLAMMKRLRDLSDYDLDDALRLVGLRRRSRTAWRFASAFGLVLGGVAFGALLGLMLAPREGREFRRNLQGAIGRGRGRGQQPGYGASASVGQSAGHS